MSDGATIFINKLMKELKEEKTFEKTDVQLRREGSEIILPALPKEMTEDEAIETLGRIKKANSQIFTVHEKILGAPWDALAALTKAIKAEFGVLLPESTQGWFGDTPPELVTISTGLDTSIQVPQGKIVLPGIPEPVQIHMQGFGACLHGKVNASHREVLKKIARTAQTIVNTDSIYKSKAIMLKLDIDDKISFNPLFQPEFIDLAGVSEDNTIHNIEVEAQIKANILGPLKFTEACRRNNIPLKRGILLEGPYGTGKTLTAKIAAKIATDNGWTFVMLSRSQGLNSAIEFAKHFQPAVIFAEDIDRASENREEDESVNDLVNTLDGIMTKGCEIMVVLTTNFIERIDQSLLRPGRFDAVIKLELPNQETVQKIIHLYGGELIPTGTKLDRISVLLDKQPPALIREVVDRSKIFMLMEDRKTISSDDLIASTMGMKAHMDLLRPKSETKSEEEILGSTLVSLMKKSIGEVKFQGEGTDSNGEETTIVELRRKA